MFKVTNQITRNKRWRNPSEIFCFTFKLDFKKVLPFPLYSFCVLDE